MTKSNFDKRVPSNDRCHAGPWQYGRSTFITLAAVNLKNLRIWEAQAIRERNQHEFPQDATNKGFKTEITRKLTEQLAVLQAEFSEFSEKVSKFYQFN